MDEEFEGKTATVHDSLTPSWNYTTQFTGVEQLHHELEIKVMDEVCS